MERQPRLLHARAHHDRHAVCRALTLPEDRRAVALKQRPPPFPTSNVIARRPLAGTSLSGQANLIGRWRCHPSPSPLLPSPSPIPSYPARPLARDIGYQ